MAVFTAACENFMPVHFARDRAEAPYFAA